MRRLLVLSILAAASVAAAPAGVAAGAEPKAGKDGRMSYGEAREFLARHTKLVELTNGEGARVAICPEWQGRVMTSTCGGMDGPSFGFINRSFVEEGKPDLRFNNYGGEERMWLSPEGGQFSLWFKPGVAQTLDNWYTPPAMNEGAWKIVSQPNEPCYRMTTMMQLQNASGTDFRLEVTREVRLIGAQQFGDLFGARAAELAARPGVRQVGYETVNRITNRGPDMSRQKGLVSIWILGMLNAAPRTVVMVPYRPGSEDQLGPVIKSDYFGQVPPERLKVTPEAVLFKADGKYRSKIGASQRRVRDVLGSIDFAGGVLTLVRFSMPDDPAARLYMNNMWQVPQEQPYVGDVANSYNDGPNDLGTQMGAFYEVESLSPARELKTGESLEHRHRTVHIEADPATLEALASEVLGVDLKSVRQAMTAR